MFDFIRKILANLTMCRIKKIISVISILPNPKELKNKFTFSLDILKYDFIAKLVTNFIKDLDGILISNEMIFNTAFTHIISSKRIRFFNSDSFLLDDVYSDSVEIAFIRTKGIDSETEDKIYEKLTKYGCKIVIRI